MGAADNGREHRCLRGALFAAVLIAVTACTGDGTEPDPNAPRVFEFGPFELAPGEEVTNLCVSARLENTEPLFVRSVELTTTAGFHHSNWFHVPTDRFRGEDGVWPCDSRAFNEPIASFEGGVLFAQSTQATHELQSLPAGAAIPIPPSSKVIAGLHLLNASDVALSVPLTLTVTPVPREDVTIQVRPLAIDNTALALPPGRKSALTTTCDLAPMHQNWFGRDPDFRLFYYLPHYHTLGTSMRLESIDAAGTSRVVFDNDQRVGDALGGPLDPPFELAGDGRLRMTCNFDNPRATTVGYGVGDEEMCVLLAFTDSPNQWGCQYTGDPATGIDDGSVVQFSNDGEVYSISKADL
jgi:hypothetical protein